MSTAAKKGEEAGRTRAEAKEASRAALIAAGIELIREQGIDGPSLDDICERAGYTRGAFYVHFEDRDDFLVAVMDWLGAAFLQSAVEGGFQSSLSRFLESFARGHYPLGQGGVVRPYQLYDACARSPVIRERYLGLIAIATQQIASMMSEEQKSGVLRDDVDARRTADIMLALTVGMATLSDLGAPVDLAGMGKVVQSLLLKR